MLREAYENLVYGGTDYEAAVDWLFESMARAALEDIEERTNPNGRCGWEFHPSHGSAFKCGISRGLHHLVRDHAFHA